MLSPVFSKHGSESSIQQIPWNPEEQSESDSQKEDDEIVDESKKKISKIIQEYKSNQGS